MWVHLVSHSLGWVVHILASKYELDTPPGTELLQFYLDTLGDVVTLIFDRFYSKLGHVTRRS